MTVRMHEDPEEEAASLMAWMDRRLEMATVNSLPLYVLVFKAMWESAFGTLDTIPQEYKDKLTDLYQQLKRGDQA